MSVSARKVTLDSSGNGTTHVNPTFYAGAKGGGVSSVRAHGNELGTAFLTRGTMPAVDGQVDVSGTPSNDVFLYFDFD
jgi:hypothetical protein